MEEYITIAEAARRLGDVSDKTIRRAIHAGKLAARYPQPNRAEVSLGDLQAWHNSLHVQAGETQSKLEILEHKVAASADLWQKTRAAMDAIEVQQETLRFEVITQLSKFATIIKEQDELIKNLTARVEALENSEAKKIKQPPAELKLPQDHVWLSDFADQHYVPRNEAQRLYELHAIHGYPISKAARSRKYIAIGSKGRHDFWIQLYTRPDFRSCDACPHTESGQRV